MAFHFFSQRYEQAVQLRRAMMAPQLKDALETQVGRQITAATRRMKPDELAESVRIINVKARGVATAANWTDAEALAWLRGHDADELSLLWEAMGQRWGGRLDDESRAIHREVTKLSRHNSVDLRSAATADMDADQVLGYLEAMLPANALESATRFRKPDVQQRIKNHPVLNTIKADTWDNVLKYKEHAERISREAGEYAAIFAINDMLPFVDSHEFKTQFAEVGRGFLPFWYAEENFLKRWGRTLIDQGPLSTIRKAQLSYMGLKQAGVIRSDQQGRDYFVYPGSTLLIEAVSKIWPGAELPVGMMFQTPTDRMLPGLSGERTGQPSFSPLVSVPLALLTARVPELVPLQRVLVGDFAAQQGALSQLVPTQLQNFWTAFAKGGEASSRYASAQMSAIAMLEARGEGLPDDATIGERDEFLRKVNNHARIILVSQAIAGFFVPGPPQQMAAGQDSFTGLGIDDPRGILNEQYQELVQNLGIEAGTQEFLQTYPLANLEHIVKSDAGALALTQGQTYSRSGAPLPATTEAMTFYDSNLEWMQALPYAGPWLLPQLTTGTSRDQYAYDQQTINGLRLRQTPEEFLVSIKFKEAAGQYFEQRTLYLDMVAEAQKAGKNEQVTELRQQWESWATIYKASHPVFREQLESSTGRQRRQQVITEMRRAVKDPLAPKAAHFDTMRNMMLSFDNYKIQLSILGEDRSAKGRARVEKLKADYAAFMDQMVVGNPTAAAFWSSVLRPEASLD